MHATELTMLLCITVERTLITLADVVTFLSNGNMYLLESAMTVEAAD
jgi:hypothetical protein